MSAATDTTRRLIGEWESRSELVTLANLVVDTWGPDACAVFLRLLSKRLPPGEQYVIGAELLADTNVATAPPAKVAWARGGDRAGDIPSGMVAGLIFNCARRLDPSLQRALAAEILAPLGPALSHHRQ